MFNATFDKVIVFPELVWHSAIIDLTRVTQLENSPKRACWWPLINNGASYLIKLCPCVETFEWLKLSPEHNQSGYCPNCNVGNEYEIIHLHNFKPRKHSLSPFSRHANKKILFVFGACLLKVLEYFAKRTCFITFLLWLLGDPLLGFAFCKLQ